MLKTRVLTAIALLALFLSALFLAPPAGWLALCALVLGLAAWEWGALGGLAGTARGLYVLCLAGAFLWLAASDRAEAVGSIALRALYVAAALFWVVLVPLWLWRGPRFGGKGLVLAAGAAALVPACVALVELRGMDRMLLLAVMLTVWISDSAAYFVGTRFGRHRLAPAISPGKSWEGVAGALAAVAIYAVAAAATGLVATPDASGQIPSKIAATVLVLLALAVAGIVGDLFKSLIKRRAGVKDSGTLLPGHGGIVDRIDALLPVLPLAVLIFFG